MVLGYLRLALFALGLLVGVQVPGFMQSYTERVAAQRDESAQSLSGFKQTAEHFFAGDLQALLAHYQDHQDPVIRSDAASLAHLLRRADLLESQWQAMQGPWYQQALHLLTRADAELLAQTRAAYRYQVRLAPEAIAWGLSLALVLAWLIEALVRALAWLVLPKSQRRPSWR